MNKKVIEIVRKYVEEHLDKSDQKQEFEVFVVWQCYILGNAKWLLSTTLPDGMYYEVTYNKVKNEFYLDAYKKFENRCHSKQVMNHPLLQKGEGKKKRI